MKSIIRKNIIKNIIKDAIKTRKKLLMLSISLLLILLIAENSFAYNLTFIGADKKGTFCIFKIDEETAPIKVGQTYKKDEILIHVFKAYPLKGENEEDLCEFITNLKEVNANRINGNIYSVKNNVDNSNKTISIMIDNNNQEKDNSNQTTDENKSTSEIDNEEDKVASNKRFLGFFEWIKKLILSLFRK